MPYISIGPAEIHKQWPTRGKAMSSGTYQITECERARIAAQVAYTQALLQQTTPTANRWTSISTFIATFFGHPAVIALLGSGLLALVLANYQHQSALRDKRIEITAALPADLHKIGTILAELQRLKYQLATSKFLAGVSHDQVFDVFKFVLQTYITQ
jgi:hypothetical protein